MSLTSKYRSVTNFNLNIYRKQYAYHAVKYTPIYLGHTNYDIFKFYHT